MSKEFDDLSSLTAEQQAAIQEFLYKNYSSRPTDDNTQFVIPFIAMNDGQTPAQIKASSQGIYKDIQRSPFLRKTGTFKADGSIEDIDITALVYYGTLQQAKVAPTLENIDVKLYVREPGLKKVPSSKEEGLAADTYFWREVHPGFHVYNNDTIYGYDWVVLQESYASTAGVYNLHMNIENGLGACKIGGHRSPVTLAGVQYKVVITAKSLWNREYSLLDSMPLIQNLEAETSTLAPSVNAIKEYYSKAVETAKLVTEGLFVTTDGKNNYAFTVDNNGIFAEDIKLKDIESLYNHVKAARADIDKHLTLSYNPALDSQYPHGLNNAGINGNINAHSLAGLTISNAYNTVSENITAKDAYIPYVNSNQVINLGHTVKNHLGTDANSPSFDKAFAIDDNSDFWVKDTVNAPGINDFKYLLAIPSTKLIARIRKGEEDNSAAIELSAGSTGKGNVNVTLNKLIANSVKIGDKELDKTSLMHLTGSSSLAYKEPISESLPIKFEENILTPNVDFDQDGNPVSEVDLTGKNTEGLQVKAKEVTEAGDIVDAVSGLTKLGSALQALHELPLSTYEYKGDQNSYKEQLGIFVERVNQLRDGLLKGDIKPGHKRNSRIQSSNGNIIDSGEGLGIGDAAKIKDDETERYYGEFKNRVNNNEYEYTDEEVKSIAHYLDLMTSKQELSHDIKNTVGILLKAAQETQDRLLDVETAVYGWDASSIPGEDKTITGNIDQGLQAALNNSPLFLGLNRLMRALCLEVYDTTDLETIDAETVSVATDSDTLKEKVTIKSRMDQIDILISRIQSEVAAQTSALAHMYIENVENDECAHTYTNMYHIVEDKKQSTTDPETVASEETEVLTKEEPLTTAPIVTDNEDVAESLLDEVKDSHETDIGATYDEGRTWNCLPSADDLKEKSNVGFANISNNAGKHTPTKDECGIVRVPKCEAVEYNVVAEDGKTYKQTWKKLELSKTKTIDSNGQEVETFKPVFSSKVVAWDSAKLERMNNKLSEVTKTIYGVDDVVASLPNRTEVLRRNITNLIDDLYPNRTFDVEPEVKLATGVTSDIRAPFKASKVQNPASNTAKPVTDEEKLTGSHTSIIKYFDDALFNFTVDCNFINSNNADYAESSKSATGENNSGFSWKSNFDSINIDDKQVKLKTEKLITDEADTGSYNKAYSRLDYIENLIGAKDCYDAHLFDKDILTITGLRNLSPEDLNYSITENIKPELSALQKLYNNEIGFTDLSVTDNAEPLENGTLSEDLRSATTTNAYLSRKLKTIQERVTTLEAYADEISKGMQSIHPNVVNGSEETVTRYEASDSTQVFKDLGEIIHDKTAETLVYDLDLSESLDVKVKVEGEEERVIDWLEHNRKVWSIVTGSKEVTKSAYTPTKPNGDFSDNVTGYYTLNGTYVREHPACPFETAFEIGKPWEIYVLYCNGAPVKHTNELNSNRIYLKSKSIAKAKNFVNNFAEIDAHLLVDDTKSTDDKKFAASYQNQTEANIYKTIQNLFNSLFDYDPSDTEEPADDSLYYKAMLRAHPVGTVYFTADDKFNPRIQFGGKWLDLPKDYVIQTGCGLNDDFSKITAVNKTEIKTALTVTGELKDDAKVNIPINDIATQLSVEAPESVTITGSVISDLTFEGTQQIPANTRLVATQGGESAINLPINGNEFMVENNHLCVETNALKTVEAKSLLESCGVTTSTEDLKADLTGEFEIKPVKSPNNLTGSVTGATTATIATLQLKGWLRIS